jgi:hypothetical protein
VTRCWLALALFSTVARADTKVTQPYPGVTHTVYTDATAPLRAHLVTIDITSQEIHLYAPPRDVRSLARATDGSDDSRLQFRRGEEM